MSAASTKFSFGLPFKIAVTEGKVTQHIVIPLKELKARIVIHPPRATDKRFIYQSPQKQVWVADMIDIDIETEPACTISFDDQKALAEDYLQRFLRYCRAETKQFQIDLAPSRYVTYVQREGQRHPDISVSLTYMAHHERSLNDSTWDAIGRDLITRARVPFYLETFLDALSYRSRGDYRMAVLNAAMGIESILKNYLRKKLTEQLGRGDKGTPKVVKDFLRDISNKFLVRIMLPLFLSLDQTTVETCRRTLDLRNELLHSERKSVPLEAVHESIRSLAELMSVDEIVKTSKYDVKMSTIGKEVNEKS